jgi:hypothetical protein
MSAIDKLAARPTLQRSLVQQAMQEAQTDPAAQQKLQQLVDQRAGDFESPALCDVVQQFLQGLSKDKFEIVANRQAGIPGRPEVLEARITKVKDQKVRVDLTPPPPAPPSWRRDPLNVTGKAPAGSKVEFYNASIPGRPALGSVTADATGKFSYELTDETKFVFGDQIGVRLVGHDGTKGRPLIVPTEPFLITNTETTYFQRVGGVEQTVRVDQSSSQAALDKKTDARPPFFQQAKVDARLDIPAVVEQPYSFTLLGKDDAVEPNSTVTVKVGNETFQTKVDDQGQFGLKVTGVLPGQRLNIEVRDINGNGVDIPARVPPIALPTPQLIAAMQPGAHGVDVDAAGLVPPGGALIVRNARTGVIAELRADEQGRVKGTLAGIEPLDAFEICSRDVNGHVSESTAWLASLPAGGKQKAAVVDVATLNATAPDLGRALSCVSGPPVDVVVAGQVKPGGPYLPLTGMPKLPPHAVLEVIKDGAVVQALRADADGVLNGMLRGVHVGDALSFQLKDAVGRVFPGRAEGFVVPDGQNKAAVSTHVPPALVPLSSSTIGSGALELDPAWLAPATIAVGPAAPKDFQQRHALVSQLGGAIVDVPDAAFMAAHAPDVSLEQGATLSVRHEQGRKVVTVDINGLAGATHGALSFGYDDTLHQLTPALTEADIPRLQKALAGAVAVVTAAYARGLEPGDVGYDRSLGVAKTLMFLLDRVAQTSPAAEKAAVAAAVAVLGTKPFLLELTPKGVVGAGRALDIETQTSSSKSLLQTRMLAMGAVSREALTKATHGAVDVAALSAAASYAKGGLAISGKGLVAKGDELLVHTGDTVHVVRPDAAGVIDVKLAIAPGTVVEIAQRTTPSGEDTKHDWEQERNPIVKAVVVGGSGILGEGNLVPLAALTQKAPSALAVAAALFDGGPAPKGLPPGGSVVVAKDGVEVGRVAVLADGTLQAQQLKTKPGDIVDVRVHDAANRPFAAAVLGHVVGQPVGARERLDTSAMSLSDAIAAVGTGALALPAFPKSGPYGDKSPSEMHAELKPTWGHSGGVSEEHGRYRTRAAFPAGLLPDLAKGPAERRLSMGDSVSLSAVRWDDGRVSLSAGYYVENQRPDFGFIFDEKTGALSDRWNTKTPLVPEGLAKLSTLLQTSIAFLALAQAHGSEPGDGPYDLAARTAKSTLVIFDQLTQTQPTFATEIKAALRAALPPSMPFDLPVGNAAPATQVPPSSTTAQVQAFWSAIENHDWQSRDNNRPWNTGVMVDPPRLNHNAGYFAPMPPRRLVDVPAASTSEVPMYLRTRLR